MKPLSECKAEFDKQPDGVIRMPSELIDDPGAMIVTISGNGMTDFDILDGDTLVISSSVEPRLGDVAMISIPQLGGMLRQILFDDDKGLYVLHASGIEKREDIYVEEPRVVGVVTHILRKYKRP